MTRAVAKLGPFLQRSEDYTFCTGDPEDDAATRAKVLEVTQQAASVPHIFDESLMFVNGEGPSLKEDFRNRFRNVSRLMDCVGCDKCRLWGKLQTSGYGTALKVLFELDNNNDDMPPLKRTELVALFNTYARISSSLNAVGKFRRLYEEKALADLASEDNQAAGITPAPPSVTVSHSPPTVVPQVDVDDEEIPEVPETAEERDIREFKLMRRRGPKGNTVRDRFEHEVMRFVMALRIVMRGWIRAPKTIWQIFYTELVRLYRVWVGLPVNDRWWRFQLPTMDRDELPSDLTYAASLQEITIQKRWLIIIAIVTLAIVTARPRSQHCGSSPRRHPR
ncbi:hypothetical protein G7046_g8604 [Stylonectria norvegica]|nr:hypothetical protein G7046_g8604 [Stylonectria norvegica]